MTNRLFNTSFENSLRLMILLDVFAKPQTLDMIYATDFMATYGATFGMAQTNLNGDNQYKFSEFAARREIVKKALKELVLNELVVALNMERGIAYTISPEGEDYCAKLESDYAREYRKSAERVTESVGTRSERTLISFINKMSAKSIQNEVPK